jgi:hypothetical protein
MTPRPSLTIEKRKENCDYFGIDVKSGKCYNVSTFSEMVNQDHEL